MLTSETTFTLSFNREEIPTRKEIFSRVRKTITIRWMPRLGEITPEDREKGVIELPVLVQLSYREGDRLELASKAADVRCQESIKMSTNRSFKMSTFQ